MSTMRASIFSNSCPGNLDTCFHAISWGGRDRAWGNPGKANGWAGSLKVRPPSWTAGKGKWASAVRILLPPLVRWGARGAGGSSLGLFTLEFCLVLALQ